MKRQIRRMFAPSSVPVRRLVRVRFGTLRLQQHASRATCASCQRRRRSQLDALSGSEPTSSKTQDAGWSSASTAGRQRQEHGRDARRGQARLPVLRHGRALSRPDLAGHGARRGPRLTPAALVPLVAANSARAGRPTDRYVRMVVGGEEVTEPSCTPRPWTREVSRVSQHAAVRAELLQVQRALAGAGRIIMAGRDIGTVVLPDADLKLYLERVGRGARAAQGSGARCGRGRARRGPDRGRAAAARRHRQRARDGAAARPRRRDRHRDRRQHARADGRRGRRDRPRDRGQA